MNPELPPLTAGDLYGDGIAFDRKVLRQPPPLHFAPDAAWWRIEDAAYYFQVHGGTIRRWIKSGVLRAAKFGDTLRVDAVHARSLGRQNDAA